MNVPESRKDIRKYCSKECRTIYESNFLKTTINCAYCGKAFQVYKHELPKKKYCSRECSDHSKEQKTKFECESCGQLFLKHQSRVKGEHVYCSHACAFLGMQKRRTFECVICGKPITRANSQFKNNAVCSPECNSRYARERATGQNSPVYNSHKMTCLICGKEFTEPQSRINQGKGKFCSRDCKYEYFKTHFQESGNPNWRGGGEGYRGPNWNEQRKRTLIRDNFTCQECGSDNKLVIHHKEPYDSFNGDYKSANRMSNLVVLCTSCHIKIHKTKPC